MVVHELVFHSYACTAWSAFHNHCQCRIQQNWIGKILHSWESVSGICYWVTKPHDWPTSIRDSREFRGWRVGHGRFSVYVRSIVRYVQKLKLFLLIGILRILEIQSCIGDACYVTIGTVDVISMAEEVFWLSLPSHGNWSNSNFHMKTLRHNSLLELVFARDSCDMCVGDEMLRLCRRPNHCVVMAWNKEISMGMK